MKALLLIPHVLAEDRHQAVAAGLRPKADYDALADAIRAQPGGHADILDRTSVDRESHPLVRLVHAAAGYNWALALLGFLRCRAYDVVFTHAEGVGKPLAVLLSILPRRPRHVTTAVYITGRRNVVWYRLLGIGRWMDQIFTLSKVQYDTARYVLRLPEKKVAYLKACGFIDVDFFAADTTRRVNERQLCSVGLEFRDYGTLFAAVAALPGVTLKVDAASPWSVHRNEIERLEIPPNVEICRMPLGGVRDLYAESALVVIPLRPNPIGAGLTTLVEAMAMGKPVVVTRSQGDSYAGRQDIVDGEHVLMVGEGDVSGMRRAIERLIGDPALRRRIGENARRWVRQNADRGEWLRIMLASLEGNGRWEGLMLASQQS